YRGTVGNYLNLAWEASWPFTGWALLYLLLVAAAASAAVVAACWHSPLWALLFVLAPAASGGPLFAAARSIRGWPCRFVDFFAGFRRPVSLLLLWVITLFLQASCLMAVWLLDMGVLRLVAPPGGRANLLTLAAGAVALGLLIVALLFC